MKAFERPRPTPSALADATSLLALSNSVVSTAQPPISAVSQSNQIVLNWLQVRLRKWGLQMSLISESQVLIRVLEKVADEEIDLQEMLFEYYQYLLTLFLV